MDFSTLKQEQNNQLKVGDVFTLLHSNRYIIVGKITKYNSNLEENSYTFKVLKYHQLTPNALDLSIINEKRGKLWPEFIKETIAVIYNGDYMDHIKLELL